MSERSVLVVDDNMDFANVFCEVLRMNKYEAESCNSGRQAVEILKERPYDAVFLDVRMPDMNGVDTLKEAKKLCPDAVYIMMTGYNVDDEVHKTFEENGAKFLYKPFEIDKVLNLLKSTF